MRESSEKNENAFLKTDGGKTKSNAIDVPSIALPKGGGAIKGVDEKFSVNAVNGTAAFSLPLPVGAARGAAPALALSYNSGAGNGVFGLGWNLGLSSIKRKTDQRLPQYLDAVDSDTFLLSEAEDLVPEFEKNGDSFVLDAQGNYVIREDDTSEYVIRYYRPRIEGLFARIERWQHKTTGEMKWRVITRDNFTTLYGWTTAARIADPQDVTTVFEWLPEFAFDDKGNCAHYLYRPEDAVGLDRGQAHNRNRVKNDRLTYTNLYLTKALYGNKTPYDKFGEAFPAESDYLFSTVFDYGEPNPAAPEQISAEWSYRADAFSDYKAGFEIRTTRLCRRVLLFHHFKEDEYNGLVRSLNFTYDTTTAEDFTFLRAITTHGYIKKDDGTYSQQHLPPMEFSYQPHEWNAEVKTIALDDLTHAPTGLAEPQYQFTDLFNEGLAGILTEQANGWYYKHNLGDGNFAQAKLVSPKPSFLGLGSVLQLADLDADGGKQIVSYGTMPSGYFELDDTNEWQPFRTFPALPNVNFGDPNTRLLDLNGDGKPEVVISEDNVFTWYPSLGRHGFAPAHKTPKPFNEEDGPHLVFADAKQTIFLADMSGGGLTDLVRIRNGEVCYWPNLGYGRFGAKVTMDHAPVFDHPEAFNPAYLQLADIDGSGTTDIIYLGKNKFTCWKNLSGNRFSTTPFEFPAFPEIHNQANVTVTDLLGTGVACIVWSSPLAKDAHAPLRYIDLMSSRKPHLMTSYQNNLGKVITLHYAPSTQFYLADKKAGKPWATKLHFPVHCLAKTVTEDRVSGYQFVSKYQYHHGYYDHAEREFRGFGMVEQTDAETFERWRTVNAANVVPEPLHQEPVVSKTWFHTGAFFGKERILNQFEEDYWYAEMKRQGFSAEHPETKLDDARLVAALGLSDELLTQLTADEWREAVRACKGMSLRSEVFAHDAVKFGNSDEARKKELTPYTVSTHNCVIELLQPRGQNPYAVFVVKESEAISYSYERNPADPRIAHNLNLKLDEYGNVLEAASVVYPRRVANTTLPEETQAEQKKTVIIYTQNQFTTDEIGDDVYRLRLPSEVKTYQLKDVAKPDDERYYTLADFADIQSDIRSSTDIHSDTALYHEFDQAPTNGRAQKRLIEHVRSLYYRDDLTAALPLGKLESLALPFESYQLAYTPELARHIFAEKVTDALLEKGNFTHSEGDANWWVRSGTVQFLAVGESVSDARARFFLPQSYTDPFGAITKVTYDVYQLLLRETEDAFGNKAGVTQKEGVTQFNFNYRTLAPSQMRDINGNLSEAISDELGMVKAVAVKGKGLEADDLNGLTEETTATESQTILSFFAAPNSDELTTLGKQLLEHATTRFVYDLHAWQRERKPAVVAAISREEHVQRLERNNNHNVQIGFEYSNGIGEVVMQKAQAEPGIVFVIDDTGTRTPINTSPFLRWLGNGRTIKNNKGNPVKQYEPFFSTKHDYEDEKEVVETGVTPILYYDAIGRMIKTELPDGTLTRVEFDSWQQRIYDANDTVLESDWFQKRTDPLREIELTKEGKDPVKEKQAAVAAAKHANTPGVLHFDTLGRPVLSVEHNRHVESGADEFNLTRVTRDVEGNLRSVVDARGNTVMRYEYDMLGNLVYQDSMDAGQRWLLLNLAGNPLRTWDERNHEFQYSFDRLQRPTESKVLGGDGATPLNHIFNKVIYGEDLLLLDRSNEDDLQKDNVLGRVVQLYDMGGLIDTPDYDFKGQPPVTTRRLFRKYKEVANWIDANLDADLEADEFIFATETDALGRITRQETPDKSVITPGYNEAGLLNSETVLHPDAAAPVTYLRNIDYNAKGQREAIEYGNGVVTTFHYDRDTFRLNHLVSRRSNGDPLQDLHYTFDPSGNITHIEDKSIPVVFFGNQMITGVNTYSYDALYRLVEATGREHAAQLVFGDEDNWNDAPFMFGASPGDPLALREYTQRYEYDAVGNIMQMEHKATNNEWTRHYSYETDNNRLISTTVGSETYQYPHHAQHGYMTALPHLQDMGWNFKEELIRTIRQRRNSGTPETTYYQYDGGGQRIRKVTENAADPDVPPTKKEERIYLAGYEVYRKHSGTDAGLERISLSLLDGEHRFVMIETRNDVDDGTAKQLVRYQMHNHLGSATLELDGTTRVISYEEYHPYGTTAYQAKNSEVQSAAKRYRYTGMERDEETGLSYHSVRYYLPWLGRWGSSDPIDLAGGVNLYAYSNDNPTNYSDESGRDPQYYGVIGQDGYYVNPSTEHVCKEGLNCTVSDGKVRLLGGEKEGSELGVVVPNALIEWNDLSVYGNLDPHGGMPIPLPANDGTGASHYYVSPEDVKVGKMLTKLSLLIVLGPIGDAYSCKEEGDNLSCASLAAFGIVGVLNKGVKIIRVVGNATKAVDKVADTSKVINRAANGVNNAIHVNEAIDDVRSTVQVIDRLEGIVVTGNAQIAQAIQSGDRAFFESLGMSRSQIRTLMRRKGRSFAMEYGNAMELAFANAIKNDSALSSIIADTRNATGVLFPRRTTGRSLRPDFGFTGGPLQGFIIDLTTKGRRASKLEKYHDRIFVFEYTRPAI
jgi:RHS repeat-associated protein